MKISLLVTGNITQPMKTVKKSFVVQVCENNPDGVSLDIETLNLKQKA